MAILKMIGQTDFGFLVSESNDWRSRDQFDIAVTGTGGETDHMVAGTVLAAGATAADPLVAWAGTGTVVGILGTTLRVGEDTRGTVVTRDAEVKGVDLVKPDAVTLAATTTALAGLGIIVRTNEGLYIEASGPGPRG